MKKNPVPQTLWLNLNLPDYEYATLTGTSSSDDTNLLAGLGISRGGRAGFYALALYNFSYDEDDPFEPYDSPWVYRVGVSFGF